MKADSLSCRQPTRYDGLFVCGNDEQCQASAQEDHHGESVKGLLLFHVCFRISSLLLPGLRPIEFDFVLVRPVNGRVERGVDGSAVRVFAVFALSELFLCAACRFFACLFLPLHFFLTLLECNRHRCLLEVRLTKELNLKEVYRKRNRRKYRKG